MVHVDPYLTASAVPRRRPLWWRALGLAVAAIVLVPVSSYAQGSPWEAAVNALMTSFTGPIARGLSLVLTSPKRLATARFNLTLEGTRGGISRGLCKLFAG